MKGIVEIMSPRSNVAGPGANDNGRAAFTVDEAMEGLGELIHKLGGVSGETKLRALIRVVGGAVLAGDVIGIYLEVDTEPTASIDASDLSDVPDDAVEAFVRSFREAKTDG